MNAKFTAISIVAVVVFTFFYDMLAHGVVLQSLYIQTANMWRPVEEMNAMTPICFFYHLAVAAVFTTLYGRFTINDNVICAVKTKCAKTNSGLNYGLAIGLLMGIMSASAFIYLPIPGTLAISWFVVNVIKGLGIGLILAYINYNKDCKE